MKQTCLSIIIAVFAVTICLTAPLSLCHAGNSFTTEGKGLAINSENPIIADVAEGSESDHGIVAKISIEDKEDLAANKPITVTIQVYNDGSGLYSDIVSLDPTVVRVDNSRIKPHSFALIPTNIWNATAAPANYICTDRSCGPHLDTSAYSWETSENKEYGLNPYITWSGILGVNHNWLKTSSGTNAVTLSHNTIKTLAVLNNRVLTKGTPIVGVIYNPNIDIDGNKIVTIDIGTDQTFAGTIKHKQDSNQKNSPEKEAVAYKNKRLSADPNG